MANYVGLDLGATRARFLECEGSAKKMKVVRFERVDLDAPSEGPASRFLDKEVAAVIEKRISAAKISREPVAMSWDSSLTVFRELDLPFTGEEQIRKVIKYEAESHLLNCDIDDVVVSFYKLSQDKDRSHLMVMAARKDQLMNRFDVLGRAGIDPLVVDLDVMAAFNTLSALGYLQEHKSFMVLDCGLHSTNLLLVVDGRLVSGRAIRMGCSSFTTRLAQDLDADPKELEGQASTLLDDPNKPREDDLVVPVSSGDDEEKEETAKVPAELAHDLAVSRAEDFYQKLSREVKRTLVTSRLPEPIEVIYVTGPGSLLTGFGEGIAERLNLEAPIERLRLLERVDHDLSGDEAAVVESEMCTSLGLAFKLAGHDVTNIDFRQEECRYARKFDQIKEPLLYFCFFLMFLVLMVNLLDAKMLWLKEPFFVQESGSDLAKIHKMAKEEFTKALGTKAKLTGDYADPGMRSLDFIKRKMLAEKEAIMGELGRGGTIPELDSALPVWRECFNQIQSLESEIGRFMLDDITISVHERDPYIKLNGVLDSYSSWDKLKGALEKIPGILEVKPGKADPLGDMIKFSNLHVVFPRPEEYQ